MRLTDLDHPAGSVAQTFAVTVVEAQRDLIEVIEAGAYGNPNGIIVTFSQPVEDASALDPLNYAVSGGITVQSVTFLRADRVRLNTSNLTPGMVYTVTVSGVRGRGNTTGMAANTAGSFTHGDGGLTYKVFRNISGLVVATSPIMPVSPINPTTRSSPVMQPLQPPSATITDSCSRAISPRP